MVDVASAAIEFEGGIVAAIDFKMDGIDPHFAGFLLGESHGLAAKPAASVSRNDVQFVDESVVAAKFEAKANREDDVADDCRAVGLGRQSGPLSFGQPLRRAL